MPRAYSDYLPAGCARPTPAALDAFHAAACDAVPTLAAASGYHVRWIGSDEASTEGVLRVIRRGEKTGTFTLPWICELTGQPAPRVGDPLVLIDFHGRPQLLVRITGLHSTTFGATTAADTAVDGPAVRALEIWLPLHERYWNRLLAPFGRTVSEAMPYWVERFELLYDAAAAQA